MDAEPNTDALLRAGARPVLGQVFCKVDLNEGVACRAVDVHCVVCHLLASDYVATKPPCCRAPRGCSAAPAN